MGVTDIGRALKIAADNFRGEVALVARSYLWHFGRRIGLGNFGTMWTRRSVAIAAGGAAPVSFDLLSSFVHDRDVAWIDLGGRPGRELDLALEAARQWPRRHRLLVFRVDRAQTARFVAAGFEVAGNIPDGDGDHIYLHAQREQIADDRGPKLKLRFGGRRRLAADCEFSVVEREGSVLGLTGIYETGFWRDVTWGAWGAVDRASARRDAVFEILRLTEERARANGARWFCLETADGEKYRHARRLYELYGLQLLMVVPDFYKSSDDSSEALMVYGKPLADAAAPWPALRSVPAPAQDTRLAA